MDRFSSSDEVLDFAIRRERESVDFYTDLARRVSRPVMKQVFLDFAAEERGHEARLEAAKKGQALKPVEGDIPELKIADYVVEVELKERMDYQEALIVAMKREKAAFRLYNELAGLAERGGETELRDTFAALAQDEARHKLRFEIEYDDNILSADW